MFEDKKKILPFYKLTKIGIADTIQSAHWIYPCIPLKVIHYTNILILPWLAISTGTCNILTMTIHFFTLVLHTYAHLTRKYTPMLALSSWEMRVYLNLISMHERSH